MFGRSEVEGFQVVHSHLTDRFVVYTRKTAAHSQRRNFVTLK